MEALFLKVQKIKRGQWIFAGVIIVLALLAWLSFYLIVYRVWGGAGAWFLSLAAFIIFAVSVGLSFFLLRPRWLATATYFVTSALGLLFFGWRLVDILAAVVFFAAISLGYVFVRREQKNLIPFWYSRLIRHGMPMFFTGLAFALALFYSASPAGRVADAPQLSEDFVSILFTPVEYGLRAYAPEFRKDMRMSSLAELEGGEIIQGYTKNLSSEEGGKTVVQFLTGAVNSQLRATLITYKQLLPLLYLFGLFLVFRAAAMPVMWVAMGAGWLAIKIMLKLKFLELRKVNVEKEKLIL